MEVRTWARSILEDAKVQARTLKLAQQGKLAPGIHNELLHYAYGVPKHHLTVKQDGPSRVVYEVIQADDDASE